MIAAGEGLIYNADGKKLHAITCEWVRGMSLGTTKYYLDTAEAPAFTAARGARPCPACLPRGTSAASTLVTPTTPPSATATPGPETIADATGEDEHCEFVIRDRQMTAWTAEHVPLSPRTPTARRVRAAVDRALPGLAAADGEVLHATFAGAKPIQPGRRVSDADVENLLLYNFAARSFDNATAHGLRIEHDPAPPPPTPSGHRYPIALRYRLAPATEPWTYWTPVRELAGWEPVSLGAFAGEKRLVQVWWALRRQARLIQIGSPRTKGETYAVIARIHPPTHHGGRWVANRVKSVLDGIVCGFQAQRDRTTVAQYARRINADLQVGVDAITTALLDDEHAVIGAVDRLLCLHGPRGVRWLPADHELVVADVRPAPSLGDHWALSGEIHTVTPRPQA
ncbi:hypothetical protein DVA67_020650 [Solirubrobacter sp. CPCC 204708]|nr:hypothetical protein [Solirubrobacter deserti]